MSHLAQTAIIHNCIQQLLEGYRTVYHPKVRGHLDLISSIGHLTLSKIAESDAPYHDLEHTVLVTLTGQAILQGKQIKAGYVSAEDWLHVILALLCHDIGYIKGICTQDRVKDRLFFTGIESEMLYLMSTATDASLTPYHIDRSQQFVIENLSSYSCLDLDRIQHYIELTRFPVPSDRLYQDTIDYPGLVRAADLIGQLADPNYLQKTAALFQEFTEVGVAKQLGYESPQDLRFSYPEFFWNGVYPYIQTALDYLDLTPTGQDIIAHLYRNLFQAEAERRSHKIAPLKALPQTQYCRNPMIPKLVVFS